MRSGYYFRSLIRALSLSSCDMAYGQTSTVDLVRCALERGALIVDLRSDTITRPSPAMRRAMLEAEVGDDVYGEDPTVKLLEDKSAKLLNKEAAIFVTSGTMGNLISVMNHCDVRGCEAYVGSESHIALHEQGGAAQLGGVTVSALPTERDGTFPLAELRLRMKSDRLHEPLSRLVAAENTIGGRVVPQSWVEELAGFARSRGLRLHLDGARLWNASVASGASVAELAGPFDSVTFCLSKGLGAPVGSVLCGSRDFVAKARRTRKVLGGGMRQAGVLAAAGIVALGEVVPILGEDHRRAKELALAIREIGSKVFRVDWSSASTNMVWMEVRGAVSSYDFVKRLMEVRESHEDDKVIVRGLALTEDLARFVLHYEIDDGMVQAAIRKITLVVKELDREAR